MLPQPLARRVVAAARKFQDWEPWHDFTDEHLIAIELPGEPHPCYALVLGAGGIEYGLTVYCGERALEQIRRITVERSKEFVAPTLLLSFDPPAVIPPEYLELSKLAGISDRVVPTARSIDVGGRSRPARTRELRLLLQVLDALLQAHAADVLRPRPFDHERGGKVLTLAVTAEGDKVRGVTARLQTVAGGRGPDTEPSLLPAALVQLPLVDEHVVVGFEPAPFDITSETNRPWMLFVIDATGRPLLGLEVIAMAEPDDLDEAERCFAKIFASPAVGDPRLPRTITFVHARLAKALGPGLESRGVAVQVVAEHPEVNLLVERLRHQEHLDPAGQHSPAAADTNGWQRHHRGLLDRIEQELAAVDCFSRNALTAFFGDAELFDELEEEGARLHRAAFREWYVTHYRGKAGRRTVAERLLASDLPAPQRLLLQARIDARTGFYLVAALRPPVIVLRCALADHEVEIHDSSLAGSVAVGAALPARIADANGHRFVVTVGPLVPPLRIDAALADLREEYGTVTQADVQRQPERLARLWEWALDETAAAEHRQLTNTDGEPLAMVTATFQVSDWAPLLAALRVRDDIVSEGELRGSEDEHWVWMRQKTAGIPTLLAELERVADELLVHTNSEQRADQARAWLTAIPGVAFVGVSKQRPDDAEPQGRSRHRGPAPELQPEDLAQLQSQIDAQTMQWLDEVVPLLGNRTPRQAVRTTEGRELVLQLIRTWPDPGGIPGLRTPRERLRQELGLDDPASASG